MGTFSFNTEAQKKAMLCLCFWIGLIPVFGKIWLETAAAK